MVRKNEAFVINFKRSKSMIWLNFVATELGNSLSWPNSVASLPFIQGYFVNKHKINSSIVY